MLAISHILRHQNAELFVYRGMRGLVWAAIGETHVGSDFIEGLLKRNILIPTPAEDRYRPGTMYQLHPDLVTVPKKSAK
jgi:hypothetical protein